MTPPGTSRGRLRLELPALKLRDAPAGALEGPPGLEVHAAPGARLDVDDAELLRDELDLFLEERGRR